MKPLAIVDVETTGFWPIVHRIIEVGLIRLENGHVVETFERLVNPGSRVPWYIERHTGITTGMLTGAPDFATVLPELKRLFTGAVMVAHNARFDYGFLAAEYERHGARFNLPAMCTVELSRQLYPGERRHSLDAVIARHGIRVTARHRALADADAVRQFLVKTGYLVRC